MYETYTISRKKGLELDEIQVQKWMGVLGILRVA